MRAQSFRRLWRSRFGQMRRLTFAGSVRYLCALASMIWSALVTRVRRCLELEQRLDQEGFDHPAKLSRVLEHAPGEGAVALALEADLLHRRQKRRPVPRVNVVFDRHQNGPPLLVDRPPQGPVAPVQRGRKVERGRGLKLLAPRGDHRHEGAGRGEIERRRQAPFAGDLPHKALPIVMAPK